MKGCKTVLRQQYSSLLLKNGADFGAPHHVCSVECTVRIDTTEDNLVTTLIQKLWDMVGDYLSHGWDKRNCYRYMGQELEELEVIGLGQLKHGILWSNESGRRKVGNRRI